MKIGMTFGLHRICLSSVVRSTLSIVFFIFVVGCDVLEPDEESGIVGTGMVFRGTSSELKQLSSSEIEIRAQSGERTTATIANDGQYEAESVSGSGPWLFRRHLGNLDYRYGIAFTSDVDGAVEVANVHGYTDIVLRSWFLEEHNLQELNTVFESDAAMPQLPSSEQFDGQKVNYLALIDLVLPRYNLLGAQLFNDEFRADDTGIDRFLDQNSVVVNERNVTLIKTDPDNNNQTTSTFDLLLGDESGQPDLEPPSIPENLRALGNGPNEIVLVWEPSTDNAAVAGYEINRNGEPLADSPYPVYTDSGLEPDVFYAYEVRAIDLAGNKSAEASVDSSSALRTADTQRPPAPRNLTSLRETTQRTDLVWDQDDNTDVASFNVFRGQPTDVELTLLVSVTSQSVTDATISAGRAYCYQVSALDASKNQSDRTERFCTENIQIESPEEVPPVEIDVAAFAGISVPTDTHTMSCDNAFPSYSVSIELAIAEGCYLVEQNIVVDNFGVLTLNPGVTLRFSPDTQILVNSRGALISVGTVDNPVVLTGERAVKGWWRGVEFRNSDNAQNRISRTIIEYTGSDSNMGAVALRSSTNQPARLRVDGSLIRNSEWYGISIPGLDSHLDSFRGNLITGNGRAGLVNFTALPSITDGSLFENNDLNKLYVARGTFDSDMVVNDPGLPIQIDGINQVLNTLTINQGVRMDFTSVAPFIVRSALIVRGTASNPVILSSSEVGPGSWKGLQLIDDSIANLSNLIIENGGMSSPANPEGANLYANDTRFSMNNVTLRNSSSYGFHATGNQVIIDESNRITFDDNAREDVVSPDDY